MWWSIIILAVTIIGVPLGQALWHPSPDMPSPTPAQVPLFILLSIFEAVSLGVAAAFLIFGKKVVDQAVGTSKNLAWAVYISTAWLTGSWWLHDKLHAANGMSISGLLKIEYGFHVTLIIAGFILAYAFFHTTFHNNKN